jgi:hypothetical protein
MAGVVVTFVTIEIEVTRVTQVVIVTDDLEF